MSTQNKIYGITSEKSMLELFLSIKHPSRYCALLRNKMKWNETKQMECKFRYFFLVIVLIQCLPSRDVAMLRKTFLNRFITIRSKWSPSQFEWIKIIALIIVKFMLLTIVNYCMREDSKPWQVTGNFLLRCKITTSMALMWNDRREIAIMRSI